MSWNLWEQPWDSLPGEIIFVHKRNGITDEDVLSFSAAIPALQPIVYDLFVLRGSNKADAGKELDTQKEVVVSMLLRLVQYHQVRPQRGRLTSWDVAALGFLPWTCATCLLQVLEMFILVLQQCHKENEDKWKRLSRQIADVILPMIAKQQVGL